MRRGKIGLVHLSLAGYEPFKVQSRVAFCHAFDEVEARTVASCQNMGDAGARDADRVGKLRLGDVLRSEKLLKTGVHFVYDLVTNVERII